MKKHITHKVLIFWWMALMLALMSTANLLAQEAVFQGLVTDQRTGLPLQDVEVLVKETGQGMVSDRFGMFYCRSLKPGSYTLEFTHVGYEPYMEKLDLKSGSTARLKVALRSRVRELKGVEVSGEAITRVPYITASLDREEIERAATRDIGDLLRTQPNVSGIRKGGVAIDPVVRGFRFGQLNVQVNNGQKIEGGCPNRMDPTVAHIEIEDIREIEIIKGPYALRYGPSLGGVVNLKTSRPEPEKEFRVRVHGLKGYESNWNGDKEYLSVFGGDQRYFFLLSGSRKDYANFEDGDGNLIPSAFKRFSYKAQAGVVPMEGHMLSVSWETSKGRDVDYVALPMDERSDDTELWSLDYTIRRPGKVWHSLDLKLYHSLVDHSMDNTERSLSDTVAAYSDVLADNKGLRLQAGLNLGGGVLTAGVDREQITKDGDRVKNLIMQPTYPIFTEPLWNEAWIHNTGLFAEYRYLLERTELIAAVRLDLNSAGSEDILIKKMTNTIYFNDNTGSEFTNFSASAGVTRELGEHLKLSLALGRGVRSPDMLERFIILLPVGFDRFDYLGNPQLKPEANHQADLTLEYTHPTYGAILLNGFFAYVKDYITGQRLAPAEQVPLTADVLGVKQFYNAPSATLKGFEFSYLSPAQLPFKLSLSAALTYGTVEEATAYVKDEAGKITGETLLADDAMPEIPPFEGNLSLSWPLFGGQLVPRAGLRLVAAQKHLSAAFEEDETPGFQLIDVGLNYRFNEYVTVSGGINNLLDEAYYEHLNRRMISSKGNLYEPGRIFFVNLVLDI